MLLQRNIFHALVFSKNAPTAFWSPPRREEWKPGLPRRKRLKLHSRRQVHALTIVGSQRILPKEENSKDAGMRDSDFPAHQSLLDGSDVRIPEKMADSDHRSPGTRTLNSTVEYARSDLLSDRARVSVERFAMAGRELVKKTNDAGVEEGLYYNPKVGDYVIGTVASGNYGKLDIDIGAGKLAHLFRKDVIPLEMCNVRELSWAIPDDSNGVVVMGPCDGSRYVYDEEVLNLGLEVPMIAELGTVFTLEVKGFTLTGVAVLSLRSVARGIAWQRIRQLHEHKAILKVQISEWTPAGLVAKIEGVDQEEPKRLSAWLSAILSRRICELAPVGTGLVILLNRLAGVAHSDRLEKGSLEFSTSLLQRLYMDLSMRILPRVIGSEQTIGAEPLSFNTKDEYTGYSLFIDNLKMNLKRLWSELLYDCSDSFSHCSDIATALSPDKDLKRTGDEPGFRPQPNAGGKGWWNGNPFIGVCRITILSSGHYAIAELLAEETVAVRSDSGGLEEKSVRRLFFVMEVMKMVAGQGRGIQVFKIWSQLCIASFTKSDDEKAFQIALAIKHLLDPTFWQSHRNYLIPSSTIEQSPHSQNDSKGIS